MSTWHYQIGMKKQPNGQPEYGVIEVYKDDLGKIQFTTREYQIPYGETHQELVEDLQTMLNDSTTRVVLDLEKTWEELGELPIKLEEGDSFE